MPEFKPVQERVQDFDLPTAAGLVLKSWLHGQDVRFEVPRRTFYHYRRLILDRVGVDISLPQVEQWGEVERVGFDVVYLKARQVKTVPPALQQRLFKIAS